MFLHLHTNIHNVLWTSCMSDMECPQYISQCLGGKRFEQHNTMRPFYNGLMLDGIRSSYFLLAQSWLQCFFIIITKKCSRHYEIIVLDKEEFFRQRCSLELSASRAILSSLILTVSASSQMTRRSVSMPR